MKGNAFAENVVAHVQAIDLCLSNRLQMPALVLIYSGIDFMANLSRPVEQAEQTKADFVKWAEHFMSCESRLGVSGLDLYGARCGVVHAYTMNSRLSTEGKAKRIMYAWGNKSACAATQLLKSLGYTEVVVRIEDLATAFSDGIDAFSAMALKDPHWAPVVQQRSQTLFRDQPSFPGMD
jgi:hypothetical protein